MGICFGYVSLAVALSARKNRAAPESWHTPNSSNEAYPLLIEKWRHHLSAVERIAASHPAPEMSEEASEMDPE
ncbi:hypothetical protein JOE66_002526 [Subtercola frigoramans]|uniref:Uncharacterized protein n=1 Tax=Subtercola frigoramans TaxID=120298 RepID=A0ABS2L748_9MICO|nr:hypothetical protein [Subtercola frigoramans]